MQIMGLDVGSGRQGCYCGVLSFYSSEVLNHQIVKVKFGLASGGSIQGRQFCWPRLPKT